MRPGGTDAFSGGARVMPCQKRLGQGWQKRRAQGGAALAGGVEPIFFIYIKSWGKWASLNGVLLGARFFQNQL